MIFEIAENQARKHQIFNREYGIYPYKILRTDIEMRIHATRLVVH